LNSNLTLTAALLVGGESRRMGVDKATVSFDGNPLWSRQLSVLRGLQPQELVISARQRPSWCPPDVDVVLDAPPSHGPISGLAACLEAIRSTHLLVLAIDLPQMEGGHLEKLCSLAEPGRGVVLNNGDYFEPLCALYPAGALAVARAALANQEWSLQSLVRRLVAGGLVKVYGLTPGASRFYRNVNTPADLVL